MSSAHPRSLAGRLAGATGSVLVLAAAVVGLGAPPAGATEVMASDDNVITGSGVPVTFDVVANDDVPAGVSSVETGSVTGGDGSTVTVDKRFRVTFVNASAEYPNSSLARAFKTADFSVPYTVTDTDGNTASATLTVTVAGKPVSPPVTSWLLMDPSVGTKTVTNLSQLDLRAYPQSVASFKAVVPGHGVKVTGLVDAEHASAGEVTGGIELRAEPRHYVGNDIVTLQLTDTWGRSVNHKVGVSWVERAAIAKVRVKVGVGQSAHFDLRELVANTSFANLSTAGFTSTKDVWNGTMTTGAHAQDITVTPRPGFVGTSTDSVGTRFAWAYSLANPWKVNGWTGPASDAKTNTIYVDVQAPPAAADVAASTSPGTAVDLDLRAPATLPWSASTLELRDLPAHGSVEVADSGKATYTPADGFPAPGMTSATDSFTFAWIDDVGQESHATATVTVRNRPALVDHTLVTRAGLDVSVDLLAGSIGDDLRVTSIGAPSHGTSQVTSTTATYRPAEGFVGSDSFTYAAIDAHGQEAHGTVQIEIIAAQVVTPPESRAGTTAKLDGAPPAGTPPASTSPASTSLGTTPKVSSSTSTPMPEMAPAPRGGQPGATSSDEPTELRLASTGATAVPLMGLAAMLFGVGGALIVMRRRAFAD